jgi:hypothetical protein
MSSKVEGGNQDVGLTTQLFRQPPQMMMVGDDKSFVEKRQGG